MSTSPPSLKDVILASQREDEEILNVFLVGSRAWGTETANSDWCEKVSNFGLYCVTGSRLTVIMVKFDTFEGTILW